MEKYKLSFRQQVIVVVALISSAALCLNCVPTQVFRTPEKSTHSIHSLDSVLVANSLPALPLWRESFLQYRDHRINPYYVWLDHVDSVKLDRIFTVELTDSVFHFTLREVCMD